MKHFVYTLLSLKLTSFFYFLLFFKGKEVGSIIYAAIAAACLYIYLMHLVSEEATRVSHLGLLCAIVTIVMQASPLADVVCAYFNMCYWDLYTNALTHKYTHTHTHTHTHTQKRTIRRRIKLNHNVHDCTSVCDCPRDQFNQNFRIFCSKAEWISFVSLDRFLFQIDPVEICRFNWPSRLQYIEVWLFCLQKRINWLDPIDLECRESREHKIRWLQERRGRAHLPYRDALPPCTVYLFLPRIRGGN